MHTSRDGEKHPAKISAVHSALPEVSAPDAETEPRLQPKTNLQPMNPTAAEPEARPPEQVQPTTTRDVPWEGGWQPPPGRPPGRSSHDMVAATGTNLTQQEWYRVQSAFPISYTPYGTYGKQAANAVCALHWPTDHDMMRQKVAHLIVGKTVDENHTHLIIDEAVCKRTGTVVSAALDTLCGPCGIRGIGARRSGTPSRRARQGTPSLSQGAKRSGVAHSATLDKPL